MATSRWLWPKAAIPLRSSIPSGSSRTYIRVKRSGPGSTFLNRSPPPPCKPTPSSSYSVNTISRCFSSSSTLSTKTNRSLSLNHFPEEKQNVRDIRSAEPITHRRSESFSSKTELKADMKTKQTASSIPHDHRLVGKNQNLFFTHKVSPGTPFVLPHGVRIARKVERVIRDLYDVYGYDEVQSPQLYNTKLWKQSGHWDNYRDDMFAVEGYKERAERFLASFPQQEQTLQQPEQQPEPEQKQEPKVEQQHLNKETQPAQTSLESATSSESATTSASTHTAPIQTHCCPSHTVPKDSSLSETFGLKPMNCPGHCLIFDSQDRSYRDLPIRYAEFSSLHRNEPSGSLTGLTRVRRFHQDDAHVFCRPDQVSLEIASMLQMLTSAYDTFGFQSFELVLSTRPPSYMGTLQEWDQAEQALTQALDSCGRPWSLNEADGAFYGPKIDIRLVDGAGRQHQTATIQLDFQLPHRFKLSYSDVTGRSVPVMIHRAILGSVERFMAILIEQTAGWWPFWLSPRQAIVIPTQNTPELIDYANRVASYLSTGNETVPLLSSSSTSSATESTRSDQRPKAIPRTLQKFYIDVDSNPSNDKLAKLIRKAQLARYNYLLVVGPLEMESGTVHVRARDDSNAPEALKKISSFEYDDEKPKNGQVKTSRLREIFCLLDSYQVW